MTLKRRRLDVVTTWLALYFECRINKNALLHWQRPVPPPRVHL